MVRLFALLVLTACVAVPPAPSAPGLYRLVSIDGTAFAARATISFPAPGQFAGSAPCNSYSGEFTGPPPALSAATLTSTEIACDDLPDEAVFFAALSAMTLADVSVTMVKLSNATGRSMVFVRP